MCRPTSARQRTPWTVSAVTAARSAADSVFCLALAVPVIAGPLAASFGTSAVLTAGAVLIVLLTAAVLLVPEVRNMQRQAVRPGRPTLT